MFLFTTSPPRDSLQPAPVVDAIRYGADRTGTRFDYLVRTAQKESALDPAARAKTSTATGLFQFIEQTWLGLIKSDGEKYGLGDEARAISERGGGYAVNDPAARRDILALRTNPKVSAVMAGVLAKKNGETLSGSLGRSPSGADLYVAHVLGASGAVDLIHAAQKSPTRSAAAAFPEAASANRRVFYDRSGRARGAAEVYAILAANHVAQTQTANAEPVDARSAAPVYAADGPVLHGLFRTEGRRGPVSAAIARLWSGQLRAEPPSSLSRVAAYYPSAVLQAGIDTASDVPLAAGTDAPRLVSVPLPPVRPSDLGRPTVRARNGSKPLDLSVFMKRRAS